MLDVVQPLLALALILAGTVFVLRVSLAARRSAFPRAGSGARAADRPDAGRRAGTDRAGTDRARGRDRDAPGRAGPS